MAKYIINGHNSLIITPPQFAGLVNGKGGNPIFIVGHKGRAQSALRGPLCFLPHTNHLYAVHWTLYHRAAGRLCFVPTSKYTKIHK